MERQAKIEAGREIERPFEWQDIEWNMESTPPRADVGMEEHIWNIHMDEEQRNVAQIYVGQVQNMTYGEA